MNSLSIWQRHASRLSCLITLCAASFSLEAATRPAVIVEYALPANGGLGALVSGNFLPQPAGIVTGTDGNLWLTDSSNQEVIRYSLSGGISYFPIPGGGFPSGITNGPDGALWVADGKSQVDRISLDGQITVFGLPGFVSTQSITVGGDGNLWVNNVSGLGRITPAGEVTAFPVRTLGGHRGTVEFVTTGPGGNIWFSVWYTDPYEFVGVMNTSGQSELIPVPTPGNGALQLAVGPGGKAIWFTESFVNKIGIAAP